VQVLPSPIPGMNSPGGSVCDLGVCEDFRNGGIPPNPQLFPGLEYGGFWIRVLVTEYLENYSQQQAENTVKNAFPNIQVVRTPWYSYSGIARDLCLVKNTFSFRSISAASSKITDWAIGGVLSRYTPELALGVEAGGNVAVVGTAAGAVAACWNGSAN
jgi:hypothetical protein